MTVSDVEKAEPGLVVAMDLDPRSRTETHDSNATAYTLPKRRVEADEEKPASTEPLFYYPLATDAASENSSATDLTIVPWAADEGPQPASVPTWSGLTPVAEPGVIWCQRQRLINGAACASLAYTPWSMLTRQMQRWSRRC